MGDISYFISKVEFILHPTFLNHVRVVTKPPYEVVETGWGEFEIKIRVHFIDPKEKPVELFHHLTLFPPNGEPQQPKRYIVNEVYDEIVFNDPTNIMYQALIAKPVNRTGCLPHPKLNIPPNFDERNEISSIIRAQNKIKAEISSVREKYEKVKNNNNILLSLKVCVFYFLLFFSLFSFVFSLFSFVLFCFVFICFFL